MVIEIKKEATEKEIRKALEKVRAASRKKTNSAKSFGALKRGLDGLEYQRQMRDDWD